jgi:hypothetical protein
MIERIVGDRRGKRRGMGLYVKAQEMGNGNENARTSGNE